MEFTSKYLNSLKTFPHPNTLLGFSPQLNWMVFEQHLQLGIVISAKTMENQVGSNLKIGSLILVV